MILGIELHLVHMDLYIAIDLGMHFLLVLNLLMDLRDLLILVSLN